MNKSSVCYKAVLLRYFNAEFALMYFQATCRNTPNAGSVVSVKYGSKTFSVY